MRELSLYFTILLVSFSSLIQAKEQISHQQHKHVCVKQEKYVRIYPRPEQISIRHDGIFVFTPGNKLLRAKHIAFDGKELYAIVPNTKFIAKRGPCGLHAPYHKKPKGCGGCGVLLCPMNCTCYD